MGKVAYFLDFELDIDRCAFFPRPETELLVEKALEFLPKTKPCNILDIGTGSGNIAISLTNYLTSSKIVALDISDTALSVARKNAEKHKVAGRIEFIKSDLFESLPLDYLNFFDMIISNPPYVSYEDFFSLQPEVKDDPYVALYGGRDGLDFYRKISKKAGRFLKKDGILLMEIGYDQAKAVKEMLIFSSFRNIEVYKDYSGIERIIKAEG